LLREVVELYKASLKPRDNFWTEVMSRPIAALLLFFLHRTRITPNQVTFLSLLVAAGSAATLVLWRTWPGLLVAAIVLQLSYLLDCVDGQLARLRGITSPLGHQLDFLMDELKAFFMLAAVSTRLFLIHGSVELLLLGCWGLVMVASGISITTFVRRQEYLAVFPAHGAGGSPATGEGKRSLPHLALSCVERFARFLIHYPSYFFYIAVFDRLELFFYLYIGVHTAYLGRAFSGIVLRLAHPGYVPRPFVLPEAARVAEEPGRFERA